MQSPVRGLTGFIGRLDQEQSGGGFAFQGVLISEKKENNSGIWNYFLLREGSSPD
jgi:hypothetical protein